MKKNLEFIAVGCVGTLSGVLICAAVYRKKITKLNAESRKRTNKFRGYYELLNRWFSLKQEGKFISEFFEKNNYQTIAIYGMGELGNRLSKELEKSGIVVEFYLDGETESRDKENNIIDLSDDLREVDAVVVTATFAFEEIEKFLRTKWKCPIISLEEIIFDV